jgi:hypothetical protein
MNGTIEQRIARLEAAARLTADRVYTVGGRLSGDLDAALARARNEGLPESIISSYLKLSLMTSEEAA